MAKKQPAGTGAEPVLLFPEPAKPTLAERFAAEWTKLGGPELAREYQFAREALGRKWRADFAHPASRTLIEIEGGVWTGGRHTSPSGYSKDVEKYNAATLLGWKLLRVTPQMVRKPAESLPPMINFIRENSSKIAPEIAA